MYPIWEVPRLTAGMVLGLIAAFHMMPVYLSTSAMWFAVWFEWKSVREKRPELRPFVKRLARLILVWSYVFGALSGVGIWFSATTAAPRAISGLIHNYVWGWATEWVFFLIEIAGIYVYYYTLDEVDDDTHLTVGTLFALASWTTMVVIVGILTFMLTPGRWPVTGGFFDGFFNETYWPQLLMRTTGMFAVGAAYALTSVSPDDDARARAEVVRTASLAGVAGAALSLLSFLWFKAALPAAVASNLDALMTPGLRAGVAGPAAAVVLVFAAFAAKPSAARPWMGVALLVVVFGGVFSIERARELIRKPWVIPNYMYSNQLIGGSIPSKGVSSELDRINAQGVLHNAAFVPDGLRDVTDANRLEAGRMVALLECSACHSLQKRGLRSLPERVAAMDPKTADDLVPFLESLEGYPYMPPFAGTENEKKALAAYLLSISK